MDFFSSGTTIESSGCQKGWHRYREHCYFFSSEKRNWFHSEVIRTNIILS